jgi:hypothetical protein
MQETQQKLLKRPVDSGTHIIHQSFIQFKEGVALYEKWSWQGVSASSLIFINSDITQFNQDDLIKSLFEQMKLELDEHLTIATEQDYFFVNFGFQSE